MASVTASTFCRPLDCASSSDFFEVDSFNVSTNLNKDGRILVDVFESTSKSSVLSGNALARSTTPIATVLSPPQIIG
jgi:hypothetical protein